MQDRWGVAQAPVAAAPAQTSIPLEALRYFREMQAPVRLEARDNKLDQSLFYALCVVALIGFFVLVYVAMRISSLEKNVEVLRMQHMMMLRRAQ